MFEILESLGHFYQGYRMVTDAGIGFFQRDLEAAVETNYVESYLINRDIERDAR